MAHTYTALYYHLIYGTKNRERWITADIEERVWGYHGAVALDHGMRALRIGGVDDHIHALISAPPTLAPSSAVKLLKGASSRFIHQTFPDLAGFAWQAGYAAMTLSRPDLPRVERYISNQRAHHTRMTFDEELQLFLKRNGIQIASDDDRE